MNWEYKLMIAGAAIIVIAALSIRWYRRRRRSLAGKYGYAFEWAIKQPRQNFRRL